ncbi:hypothetical protein [Rubinisphaera margarita]|uniref:hypothetical protein n=1 Tax=Rubinisphaera margarita TaxID=2909586 RepID=UPI001EE98D7A|nr:hypothetical protein [Rubinisphaera margarita]MCG6156518.1 hypothetical protein [Rubinisphaera margarita]
MRIGILLPLFMLLPISSVFSSEKSEKPLPPGKLGRVVELGREIVNRTSEHPLSREYVGNSLRSACKPVRSAGVPVEKALAGDGKNGRV